MNAQRQPRATKPKFTLNAPYASFLFDPKVDALLEDARTATDQNRRAELYGPCPACRQHIASLRFHALLAEQSDNQLLGFVIDYKVNPLSDLTRASQALFAAKP